MNVPVPETQYSSVSRRPLDIADYLEILNRHKGWIFGPLFAGLVIAVVGAYLWPDSFVSVATIRVVPPQVPETFVMPNVNQRMSERVNAMYQLISSRTTLGNIITQFNLYPKQRQNRTIEDLVEAMRRDINVTDVQSMTRRGAPQQDVSAFRISFKYEDRALAQKVCGDLVSRFMDLNASERARLSTQTTQFLAEQFEAARKDLQGIDDRISNFRQTFAGRLPDQVHQNQMALNTLENRIGNLNNALSRIDQEKLVLESDLRTYKTQRAALVPAPDQVMQRQKNQEIARMDTDIARLEASLAALREHYSDKFPDVRRVQLQLQTMKGLRQKLVERDEQEKQAAQANPAQTRRVDPQLEREARELDANIQRLSALIDSKRLEAEGYRKDIQNTERQISALQTRIQATPVSEHQYAEIIRDREVARLRYEDLNRKRSQSAMAEELERRQQGETLEVLDAASFPVTPSDPDRPRIIGFGAAVGLVIGLALAGAREAKDTSLKNLKDVRAYTNLTILGTIPLLENDLVVRRRRRLALLGWVTACLLGIVLMAGAAVYYYYGTS
jgi:polysaccharide chain length determinant protein (PEP-CTERM system associated)